MPGGGRHRVLLPRAHDRIVTKLCEAGETVEVDPEHYPNGRFARLRDPEGNGIQLWQPMQPE